MKAPTQRSLKYLRDRGYYAAVVEHWNPHAKVRQDLWACDIIAEHPTHGLALIQTTTRGNMNARLAKMSQRPELRVWCKWGKLYVHGWLKPKVGPYWTLAIGQLILTQRSAKVVEVKA